MRAFLKPDEVFSNLVEGTEEALNEVFSNLVRGPHGCLTRYYTSLADRRPEAQIRRLNGWERNRITRLRGQAVKTSPFHGGNTGSIPVGVIFRYRADVAQLAEQLICNQQVIGSSPIIGFYDPQGFTDL